MKHPATRDLFAYWDRLRGQRIAPEREDVDPAAIRAILADTFMLEVVQAGGGRDFIVRLAGTRLNALAARELKGVSFLCFFRGDQALAVDDLFDAVVDDQAAVVAGLAFERPLLEGVDLELLLLPLRHHGRTHSRILGVLTPRLPPAWLGLQPTDGLTVTSMRNLSAGAHDACGLGRLAPTPDTARRYGTLVVHDGGLAARRSV